MKFTKAPFIIPFVKLLSVCAFAILQTPAPVMGQSQVQVTITDVGLQTLTYKGLSYMYQSPAQSVSGTLISKALFRPPAGIDKIYGWDPNSLDKGAIANIRNAIRSSSANPTAFQHIYRQGLSDSFTVKITYTPTDSRTLEIDTFITNNDRIDTLAQIDFSAGFLSLQLPGPAKQYRDNLPMDIGPLNQWGGYPVAFLSNTWGSVGLWMSDYSTAADMFTYYRSAAQTQFGFYLSNNSKNQIGYVYEDPIAPGTTKKYTAYLRFGSATDTPVSLAPQAFSLMRRAYPYLVKWPDRRPIARLFIADGRHSSALNPRGYLEDSTLDVSNQTNFKTRILSWADNCINIMSAMNPKPQGIMLWDLEGEEFYQPFTYAGDPPKLHDLAPEMDAVADQMFAKFRHAGYKIGMTLRPSTFMTGTTLPVTGHYRKNTLLSDVFIKSDASYPYRGYVCTAPNRWTQPGARLPNYQTMSNDDDILLSILEPKVAYAHNRWGATIFYVDSTVYTRGDPLNFNIFRKLQKDFPKYLFFPEEKKNLTWGGSAPYGQGNLGDFATPSSVTDIYPGAFSVLQVSDGVNFKDPTRYNALVNSIKNGNIFFVDGWCHAPTNASILKIYLDAGYGNSTVQKK